jgi:hypothetical protein
MALFRIYRIKENPSQQFRWAPHVSGATQVKRKDYEPGGQAEGANEYAVWSALKDTPETLRVGDVLEGGNGALSICKYVGFEAAQWIVPEVKTGLENTPAASGPAEAAGAAM